MIEMIEMIVLLVGAGVKILQTLGDFPWFNRELLTIVIYSSLVG